MDRRWTSRVSALGISAVFITAACSSTGDSDVWGEAVVSEKAAENAIFPTVNWTQGDPTELGFDAARLEEIAAEATPETNCLLVTRHGEIAGEWYWNGWNQDSTEGVMSVTQAYSSTLVGIAQDEGYLDIDDKVSKYIPEWKGTESENVTIREILSHTSGRESTNSIGNTELHEALISSPNPGEFAVGLTQDHTPGKVWSQNLPAIELLNPILTAATGKDPSQFAEDELFSKIGAKHTQMTQTSTGVTWMHAFLQTSCRDAARLGYLFLRHGTWDGDQIVSDEWVQEATHPSQELNNGWGYMWWLNRPGSLVSIKNLLTPDYKEPSDLQLNPDAPEGMFWALGFGGRYIQVHPATDTVVVRLGGGDEATNMEEVVRTITEGLVE